MKNFIKIWWDRLLIIVGIMAGVYWSYTFASITINQIRLTISGEKAKAKIIRIIERKGAPIIFFEFKIDNKCYKGDRGIFPDDVKVGDSVWITYLPSNPNINQRFKDD